MEGLIQFTGIVMIAFGILQIILFFKIWGMTNNVKRIWKKIDNKDFLSDACVSYIKGNLEETERLANEAFLQEVALLSKSSESYEDWIDNYIKIKEKYTRIFKKIDKPAPDFNKYEEPKMYLLWDIPKIIKFKATNSLRVSCLFCIFKHSPQKTV